MTLVALLDNPKFLLKAPTTMTTGVHHFQTTKLRTVFMTIHKLSEHHITRNRQAANARCLRKKARRRAAGFAIMKLSMNDRTWA